MSDNAYGASVGDGNEGGTSPVSTEQVSEQLGGQPKEQEQQASEPAITMQQLKEMEQRIIDEATRRAQSMTDKMGSRLDKEIQNALDQATKAIELGKQAGVAYTPQQEQAIRDKAINAAYSRLNQEQSSEAVKPTTQSRTQENVNPAGLLINQEVQRIMRETGVYIAPEDADKAILGEGENARRLTPYQYINAFEALARQQLNTRQPQGPSPTIPSFVQGGRTPASQTALRNAYQKEVDLLAKGKHPDFDRGPMGKQKLENKYKAQGLEL